MKNRIVDHWFEPTSEEIVQLVRARLQRLSQEQDCYTQLVLLYILMELVVQGAKDRGMSAAEAFSYRKLCEESFRAGLRYAGVAS